MPRARHVRAGTYRRLLALGRRGSGNGPTQWDSRIGSKPDRGRRPALGCDGRVQPQMRSRRCRGTPAGVHANSSAPQSRMPSRARRLRGSPTSSRRCVMWRRSSPGECPPDELFLAVSAEVRRVFGTEVAAVARFVPNVAAIEVIGLGSDAPERWELEDWMATAHVRRTGRSARAEADAWVPRQDRRPRGHELSGSSRLSLVRSSSRAISGARSSSAAHSERLPLDTERRLEQVHGTGGDGDRQHREQSRADGVAQAHRRGLGRGTAPDRARPTRRDAAASDLARARRSRRRRPCRRPRRPSSAPWPRSHAALPTS